MNKAGSNPHRHLTYRGACLLAALIISARLPAATLFVTNVADSGPGSFRGALASAHDGDRINFAVTGTIALTSGELVITNSVSIDGPGAKTLSVSAGNLSRVIRIAAANVAISGLTLKDGRSPAGFNGGGIRVERPGAALTNCVFVNNWAGSSPANGGGLGVVNNNSCTVHGCTFIGNQGDNGGGISVSHLGGRLLAVNCTFVNNRATSGPGRGGGLHSLGTATLVACTIVSNSAPESGGLHRQSGTLRLNNCVVAANVGGSAPDVNNTVVSGGYNLIGIGPAGSTWLASDQAGTPAAPFEPGLGPLQDNGGPTPTMAPLSCSRVLDAGDDTIVGTPLNLAADQRGFSRRARLHVDVGACEQPAPVGPTIVVANTNASGPGSLAQSIAIAPPGSTLTFAPQVTGTITLNGTELVIFADLRILGPGADRLTISGNDASRIITVLSCASVEISGLKISDGRVEAVGTYDDGVGHPAEGGAILNYGKLLLTQCVVTNNVVVGANGSDGFAILPPGRGGAGVGGAIDNWGHMVAVRCTIQHNRAFGGTGGRGVLGGPGGEGGWAAGGGIYSFSIYSRCKLFDCTVDGNLAQGGPAGHGGDVSSGHNDEATGGTGGQADGGGMLCAALFEATGCTFSRNAAVGGYGGRGGASDNGRGANGGYGGSALGGGASIRTDPGAFLANCTLSGNKAEGGYGGEGGLGGRGWPKGIFGVGGGANGGGGSLVDLSLANCTITANSAWPGGGSSNPAGQSAFGCGVSGSISVTGTIIAGNIVPDPVGTLGRDYWATVSSGGFNLIGRTEPLAPGFGATGDQVGSNAAPLDARLGPLQDNGGPTLTHALLAGSPALDRGRSSLTRDQRGGRRVMDQASLVNTSGGDGSDIGAVEMGGFCRITDIRVTTSGVTVWFTTDPGFRYQLESTAELESDPWKPFGPMVTGTGIILSVDDGRPRVAHRFYRAAVMP